MSGNVTVWGDDSISQQINQLSCAEHRADLQFSVSNNPIDMPCTADFLKKNISFSSFQY